MRDIAIQPGAATPDRAMMSDMPCRMTEGEPDMRHNDNGFTATRGDVRACAKDNTTEGTRNTGSAAAAMRVIDLLPA